VITPPWLLTLPIVLPLAFGVLTLLAPVSWLRICHRYGAVLTAASTLPCLRWVWFQGIIYQSPGGWTAPLGIDLYLDGAAALFLLFTSGMGLAISFYAEAYFPQPLHGRRVRSHLFWPLWFVTWGGIHSLFLTLDLFNIYVTLELISVAGVGLILLAGTPGSIRAALNYQLQALIAGLLYLLGVGLVYNMAGTLDLHLISAELEPGPMKNLGMALMTSGLLIKAALFPMHFWLPRAHADAPAPVSAVLSGLVVTVAFVILSRIWFAGLYRMAPVALPGMLGILGTAAIVWGGLLALRQERLKRILAYSTVSQMGYLFLLFSLTLDDAANRERVWAGAVYIALSHGLAKGAAFLTAGTLQRAEGSDRLGRLQGAAHRHPFAALVLAVASINLMGLPPSTGFIGKWYLLEAALAGGQWLVVAALLGGGLLAAAYLFRVFGALMTPVSAERSVPPCPPRLLLPALALALATLVPVLFITAPQALLTIQAAAPVP